VERQLRSDLYAPGELEALITPDTPRAQIDFVVYRSPLLRVGRWRCPGAHPEFADSGPASDTLFVFPRDSVWIQHDGSEPFVADMNTVTYYNAGQHYRRRQLSAWGDRCEWFAFSPAVVAEALAVHEPAAADRPDRPFVFSHGPADADSYLQQRLVFAHITCEREPDRLYVEETMLTVLGRVAGHAYQCRGSSDRVTARRRTARDVVEGARDIIARQFHRDLSLTHIAQAVGTSVFHLSRVFRARTGFPLHQYRNQLRLRTALEVLTGGAADLSRLALDLGFSSHSHFTETFRRTFGCTPSSFRRDGAWREPR
jgi:AraC-like DNA-binding protein